MVKHKFGSNWNFYLEIYSISEIFNDEKLVRKFQFSTAILIDGKNPGQEYFWFIASRIPSFIPPIFCVFFRNYDNFLEMFFLDFFRNVF